MNIECDMIFNFFFCNMKVLLFKWADVFPGVFDGYKTQNVRYGESVEFFDDSYALALLANYPSIWVDITPISGGDLALKENISNKSTDPALWSSDTLYSSQKAVKDYVDNELTGKEDVLWFTPENVANKSTNPALWTSDTLYSSQKAVKTYVDGLVAWLLDDRGGRDASVNLFPTTGGSGVAGAVVKGDLRFVSVAGTLGWQAVAIGASFRALVDTPWQTAWNRNILETNIGFVPENVANKGAANGYASLDASQKVVQDPVNATPTPTPNKIVVADWSGKADGWISNASDTVAGKVELATIAETNLGTDATRALTPDGLAGSKFGTRVAPIEVFGYAEAVTTGDGKRFFRIPAELDGMALVSVSAQVVVKSTSGLPTIQIARGRQPDATTAHAFVDMLSTTLTINANQFDSKDATPAVIDSANDDIVTGDMIRVDVDTAGTGTTGLVVVLGFRLP